MENEAINQEEMDITYWKTLAQNVLKENTKIKEQLKSCKHEIEETKNVLRKYESQYAYEVKYDLVQQKIINLTLLTKSDNSWMVPCIVRDKNHATFYTVIKLTGVIIADIHFYNYESDLLKQKVIEALIDYLAKICVEALKAKGLSEINEDESKTLANKIYLLLKHTDEPESCEIGYDDELDFTKGIEYLGLSTRAYNCFKRAGLDTIEKVVDAYNNDELIKVRNLGLVTIKEIETALRNNRYISEKGDEQEDDRGDLQQRGWDPAV